MTQYRALTRVGDRYWLLFDVFAPADGAQHDYQTWFHLNSAASLTDPGLKAVVSAEAGAANLAIVPLWSDPSDAEVICGQEEPEVQGWAHLTGYECIPVATPVFKSSAAGTCVMPYLLYPLKPGESLPVRSVKVSRDGTVEISYRDGGKDVIRYSVGDKRLERLSLTTRRQGKWDTLPIL